MVLPRRHFRPIRKTRGRPGDCGHYDRRFAGVAAALADELTSGSPLGAAIAVAVAVDGEMVVDIWGGYADRVKLAMQPPNYDGTWTAPDGRPPGGVRGYRVGQRTWQCSPADAVAVSNLVGRHR
jgi:hypothetical protein